MVVLVFIVALFCIAGCAKQKTSLSKKDNVILSEHGSDNHKLIVKSSVQAGYSEKKQKKESSKTVPVVLKQRTYKQIEAGLVDIPTPLLAQPIQACADNQGSYRLEYAIKLPVESVAAFYTTEMNRAGWDQGVLFSSDDHKTVLSFKKRTGSCVILLEPKKSWWNVQKKTHAFLYVS